MMDDRMSSPRIAAASPLRCPLHPDHDPQPVAVIGLAGDIADCTCSVPPGSMMFLLGGGGLFLHQILCDSCGRVFGIINLKDYVGHTMHCG